MKRTILALVLAVAALLLLSGCGKEEPEDLVAAFQIAEMQDTYNGQNLLRLCQAYSTMLDYNAEAIVLAAATDIVNEQLAEPLRPEAEAWLHDLLRSCVG